MIIFLKKKPILWRALMILTAAITASSFTVWADGVLSDQSLAKSTINKATVEPDSAYPFHYLVTLGAIRVYQKVISPSRGSFCPMYPSCSRYGFQAFQTEDPLTAFFMTADRLHRCGHDLEVYEPIELAGNAVRFFDPVPGKTDVKPGDSFSLTGKEIYTEPAKNIFPRTETFLNPTQAAGTPSEERLLVFAEKLELEGDYYRAITEYQRFLFYYPDSSLKTKALLGVFSCYYKAGQYLTAIHWGKDLIEQHLVVNPVELQFYIALSYYKANNFGQARQYFQAVAANGQGTYYDKSLMLKGLTYAAQFNWSEAEKAFNEVTAMSAYYDEARYCVTLSQEGRKLKLKKPVIAGLLAIIPGMGYFYDGYPQTGVSALIVNGLFFAATAEVKDNDNNGGAAMLGILSLGWYGGNIYGSVNSAERKNLKLQKDHFAEYDLGFEF